MIEILFYWSYLILNSRPNTNSHFLLTLDLSMWRTLGDYCKSKYGVKLHSEFYEIGFTEKLSTRRNPDRKFTFKLTVLPVELDDPLMCFNMLLEDDNKNFAQALQGIMKQSDYWNDPDYKRILDNWDFYIAERKDISIMFLAADWADPSSPWSSKGWSPHSGRVPVGYPPMTPPTPSPAPKLSTAAMKASLLKSVYGMSTGMGKLSATLPKASKSIVDWAKELEDFEAAQKTMKMFDTTTGKGLIDPPSVDKGHIIIDTVTERKGEIKIIDHLAWLGLGKKKNK